MHETPSRTQKTGPRHGASHRDAPEPGDRSPPPRASDDDGARRRRSCGRSSSGSSPWPSAAWRRSGPDAGAVGAARTLNARRLVMQDLQDRDVVTKLFDTIAPRFESRPGGYTRLLRLGFRKGDAAEVAQVELVGSEFDPQREGRNGGRRKGSRRRSRRVSADGCAPRPSGCAARSRRAPPKAKRARRKRRRRRSASPGERAPRAARLAGRPRVSSRSSVGSAGRDDRQLDPDKPRRSDDRAGLFLERQTSSTSTPARSAFAAAMIFVCRWAGTSS